VDVPHREDNMFCGALRACIYVRVRGVDIALIFYSVTCDGGSLIFIQWGSMAVCAGASCRPAVSATVHTFTNLVFIQGC
jgi:hypothetical protein